MIYDSSMSHSLKCDISDKPLEGLSEETVEKNKENSVTLPDSFCHIFSKFMILHETCKYS